MNEKNEKRRRYFTLNIHMNTWDYIDLKILNKERKSDKEITKILLLLLLLITRKLMFMIPIIFMFGILYYYYYYLVYILLNMII